jgi:hypothetical protein
MLEQFSRYLTKNWWIMKKPYRLVEFGDIKGETERSILAAQHQAIVANYFKNKASNEATDSKCR